MNIDYLTIIFAVLFSIPIISGAFKPFSSERIFYSIGSLFDNIKLIVVLAISIFLTKMIYFERENSIYQRIYDLIPASFKEMLEGRDLFVYFIFVPIIAGGLLLLFWPASNFIFKKIIDPLSDKIYDNLIRSSRSFRRLLSGLVQVPKSILWVFVFGLFLNFFNYYYNVPVVSKMISESYAYNFIYNNGIVYVLDSSIAKKIPVILNDTFRQDEKMYGNETLDGSVAKELVDRITGKNIRVIKYFNGVTLNKAIKSNDQIDTTAIKLVGNESSSYKKACILYNWVSKNLEYDYDKAKIVGKNPKGIESGSIVAFKTRKGICFDYSCLYISMCRAVDLKVRLITGLGYSGLSWGDHAWNQVYDDSRSLWINVDTTFGTMSNYFDRKNFDTDHKYAELQGEW